MVSSFSQIGPAICWYALNPQCEALRGRAVSCPVAPQHVSERLWDPTDGPGVTTTSVTTHRAAKLCFVNY